jgi:hypothetical protein
VAGIGRPPQDRSTLANGFVTLPSETTFCAIAEFAHSRLAERVRESLIQAHLGTELNGHQPRRHCDRSARAPGRSRRRHRLRTLQFFKKQRPGTTRAVSG